MDPNTVNTPHAVALVLLIATLIVAFGVIAKFGWRILNGTYKFVRSWEEDREAQQLVNELVLYHLNPNHGHSLLDRVHRSEIRLVRLEQDAGFMYIEPLPERRSPPRHDDEQ